MNSRQIIALLRDDLKDDDFTLTIRAIKELKTAAAALGPSDAKSQLLPLLTEFVTQNKDMDEAHCEIAKQLGGFAPLLGGANHVAALLPLLEQFAGEEETVIREAAVGSLKQVAPVLLVEHRSSELFPLIKRLADCDWFPSRCSACPLTVTAYPLLSAEEQKQLRTSYAALCKDDTPMVRRSAYQNMGDLSVAVEGKHFLTEILPLLRDIAQDDMDNLRLFTADICSQVAQSLNTEEYKTFVLPLVEGCQTDSSWRVRSRMAEQMPTLVNNMQDKQALFGSILRIFSQMLVDREPEVRSEAIRSLSKVTDCFPGHTGLVEHIGPALETLSVDEDANVRRAFSATLVPLCNTFPRDAAVKLLLPIMQALTHDELPIVRHNVISNLGDLKDTNASGILGSMVPQLFELAKDPKWRVRMAVVKNTALVAKSLGQRVFERKFQNLVMVSLSDHVSSIREAACEQSSKIVSLFGTSWARSSFFPSAFTIYDTQTNYLHRMTCLLLMLNVAKDSDSKSNAGGDLYEKTFFPLLTQAFVDDVANVRLMACQTLLKMLPFLGSSCIDSRVKPALARLVSDDDSDVSYFAGLCNDEINPSS